MVRSHLLRILVIDDQPAVADVIHDALSESGYTVTVAASAAEGLSEMARERADLVILDLGLPDMPGLDLLDRVHLEWPKVPVVILSGTEDPVLAQRTLAHGAADYVTKPFDIERLRQVVAVVLTMRR